MNYLQRGKIILICVALASLIACGQSRVVRREPSTPPRVSRAPSAPIAGLHTVQQGDTLYGIAFRAGVDFRDVAAWNGIAAPYLIYPGQKLRLQAKNAAPPPRITTPAAPSAPVIKTPPSQRSITGMPAPKTPLPAATTATEPVVEPAPKAVAQPATTPAQIVTPPPIAAPETVPTPTPTPTPAASKGQWQWPAQGQIIGRFISGDPTQQGIDIAGTAGQAVVAAADGVVVYSGTGLVGYGEVIIVKHSDEWLSAYGHNRSRLVAEGVAVKAGQTIAELGRSGTSRDMLHFEIRRNGKPVDPISLLPAR